MFLMIIADAYNNWKNKWMCFVGSYLLVDSGVKGCGGWDYGGNWRRNL